MEELEYLYNYRRCSISQNMENGNFVAFDPNGKLVSNEATQVMVKNDIDILLDGAIKP